MRERGGFIRPEWWDRKAREGSIRALEAGVLTARGRERILLTEKINDFSSNQRGSMSPILLATLPAAAALMLFLSVACSQAIGSPPETPISPAATSTPIARPTELPTPNATATAEATIPIFKNLILGLQQLDLSPEKDGANRNVGDTVRARIVNELTLAQKAYREGQTSEWQKALKGAEFEFTGWVGPGGRTPPTKEEVEKYGKWGRQTGVTPLYQPAYFDLIEFMKRLGYWVNETGKDGWR